MSPIPLDSLTLYVMQNEHGLIKIGRSKDPLSRLDTLQMTARCRLELVQEFPRCGHREENVLRQLEEHRVEGEWFSGEPHSRSAIEKVLPHEVGYVWPFEYNSAQAGEWLEGFRLDRALNANRRFYHRIINAHLGGTEGNTSYDHMIGRLFAMTDRNEPSWGYVHVKGKPVIGYRKTLFGEVILCPPYSTDIDAALRIWPDDFRPVNWSGSALECARAALKARSRMLNS